MFSLNEVSSLAGRIQFRTETLTGIRCRISTERVKRALDRPPVMNNSPGDCPFCPGKITAETPVFPDGSRIIVGESVTFPNLFPFSEHHTVTVITSDHFASNKITEKQIADALTGQYLSLKGFPWCYPSINWNNLPSAGASIVHPHMQAIADNAPTYLAGRYIEESRRYFLKTGEVYYDNLISLETDSERFLFGDEISWIANAVPVGEREVRGYLPVHSIDEFEPYIDVLAKGLHRVITLYKSIGNYAFNAAIYFDRCGTDRGFRSFCSVIARINPNPMSMSDTAFMERLHMEPVILTLPEDLGRYYREFCE